MNFYPAFHKCLGCSTLTFPLQDCCCVLCLLQQGLCPYPRTTQKRVLPSLHWQVSKTSGRMPRVLTPASFLGESDEPLIFLWKMWVFAVVPLEPPQVEKSSSCLDSHCCAHIYLEFANALHIIRNRRNLQGFLIYRTPVGEINCNQTFH